MEQKRREGKREEEGMVKRDIRFQGEGRSRRPFKLKGMTRDREKEREKRESFRSQDQGAKETERENFEGVDDRRG